MMPLTVITVKNAPPSLRGDLTKWMQEIATGVYIGNFNVKIRDELWDRVLDSIGSGEATMSFSCRNEIGYDFKTHNADREVIYYDKIPLVLIPKIEKQKEKEEDLKKGFSKAANYRKARKFSGKSAKGEKVDPNYIVIDIETDGLDKKKNSIIEIGALKKKSGKTEEFSRLIKYEGKLPESIIRLTGITDEMLAKQGVSIENVLTELLDFLEDKIIVGYSVEFDLSFLNHNLRKLGMDEIKNENRDLLRYVKKEKKFLASYKLENVLEEYGIEGKVPHRALGYAELIYKLSERLEKFQKSLD